MSHRGGNSSGPNRSPAFKEALRALALRDHFSAEMRQKLQRRGHPPEEVESALASLFEMGYLNDEKQALRFATSQLSRGRGAYFIASRLTAMGVKEPSPQVTAAEEGLSLKDLLAKKKIDPGSLTDPKDRAKILRFLKGRGYRPQVISSVLGGADFPDD